MTNIVRKIKCKLGFHQWGSFWKDGWIPKQLINKHSNETTHECRVCTYCTFTERREQN
jgi:hypothetical protein